MTTCELPHRAAHGIGNWTGDAGTTWNLARECLIEQYGTRKQPFRGCLRGRLLQYVDSKPQS